MNFYHFINDPLAKTWHTLVEHVFPDGHIRRAQPINVTIIAENSKLWLESPWAGLFNFLSVDQKALTEVEGLCFTSLIIGSSHVTVSEARVQILYISENT